MNKNEINSVIEYITPTLILSYFLVHNIIIVLIGIALSLYLINIDFINKFSRSTNKFFTNIKSFKDHNKDYKAIKSNSNQIELNKKNIDLTIVEAVEELGFIPSLDKNDDKNAA